MQEYVKANSSVPVSVVELDDCEHDARVTSSSGLSSPGESLCAELASCLVSHHIFMFVITRYVVFPLLNVYDIYPATT